MELNSTSQKNKQTDYSTYKDWKFVSIVQFGKGKLTKLIYSKMFWLLKLVLQ
jgi:hypothetical protein